MTARIAVLRALPGLGDLLCAVPALRAIRAEYGDADVTLIGLPGAAWFAERFRPYVDRLLPLTSWPGLPEATGPPHEACSFLREARRQRFDLALQLHGDGTVTNDLVARLGARRIGGMVGAGGVSVASGRFVEITAQTSEVGRLLTAVRAVAIPVASDALEWPEYPAEGAEAEALVAGDAPYAVLHAGASLESRRWDPRGFARSESNSCVTGGVSC